MENKKIKKNFSKKIKFVFWYSNQILIPKCLSFNNINFTKEVAESTEKNTYKKELNFEIN